MVVFTDGRARRGLDDRSVNRPAVFIDGVGRTREMWVCDDALGPPLTVLVPVPQLTAVLFNADAMKPTYTVAAFRLSSIVDGVPHYRWERTEER
jgi:hypothetical protein